MTNFTSPDEMMMMTSPDVMMMMMTPPNNDDVTGDVTWLFVTATAIWSYLLLVVLSPKPRCVCSTRMRGMIAVVTGGTDGIGKVTAEEFAARGAVVIIPCRNLEKGRKVAAEIRRKTGSKVHVVYAEFTKLETVQRCAREIRKLCVDGKLDILVNNAGIGHGVGRTVDGFPLLFGVNHLAPFLLTTSLLDLLRAAGRARVIMVSSIAHRWGRIRWDKLHHADGSWVRAQFRAYAQSKLANVVFAKQLARDERKHGVDAFVAHPGWTFTSMFRDFPLALKLVAFPLFHLFLYRPREGAQTQIHLALSPRVATGSYYVACRRAESCACADDRKLGRKLSDISAASVAAALSSQPRCNAF